MVTFTGIERGLVADVGQPLQIRSESVSVLAFYVSLLSKGLQLKGGHYLNKERSGIFWACLRNSWAFLAQKLFYSKFSYHPNMTEVIYQSLIF